ncbi:hypothetical protein G9A89_004300 [Geosiphon pyriformis]|nr:hypothetical protein G9A89_004300 [Geosiphon pyriformis]
MYLHGPQKILTVHFKTSFVLSSRSFSNFIKKEINKNTSSNFSNRLLSPHLHTESATSAITYKLKHPRQKPPPLPQINTPTPSAEEAVTNILYNTPGPSRAPAKRHILNCLVQNEPGVLSRISGILAGRGFNIDSLVVARTEAVDLSRMTIVLRGRDDVVEQARRQLEDLVPVWAVLDYTETTIVERELLLIKVSILGLEHLHEQLAAIKHDVYDDKFMPEADLEISQKFDPNESDDNFRSEPMTPSSALRQKHSHLCALKDLAKMFGGKLVDVSNFNVVIELSAKPSRVDAFIKLVKPFGILEAARSGMMALPRTPIHDISDVGFEKQSEDSQVDATMLPPG